MEGRFSVNIVTRNNKGLLSRIIPILLNDPLLGQLVIVNNNSRDGTKELLSSISDIRLLVLTNNSNVGVVKAVNRGLSYSNQEYTLVLDDDQIPSNYTLRRYAEGVVSCDILGTEPFIIDLSSGVSAVGRKDDFSYMGAGGMCMKTSLWKSLNYFDEVFHPAYFESPDLCMRAMATGCSMQIISDSGVEHIGNVTLSRSSNGFNSDLVHERNKKVFLSRYRYKRTEGSILKPKIEVGKEEYIEKIESPNITVIENPYKEEPIIPPSLPINITYSLQNTHTGGTENHVLSMLRWLDKTKFKPSVIITSNMKGILHDQYSKYADVYYTDFPLNRRESVPIIIEKLKELKPDILHLESCDDAIIYDAVKAFDNSKTIQTIHSCNVAIKYKTDVANVVSKYNWKYQGCKYTIPIIYNGINLELFKDLNSVRNNKLIITHSRLVKIKDNYFKTIKNVAINIPDIKFVLVGRDSGELKNLKNTVKIKGLENNVEILPEMNQEELVTLLNKGSLWFLPTTDDNFPLSVLEAMACGLPVITSNIGGIPEMMVEGMTGYMCNPNDTTGFARIIINTIRSSNAISRLRANIKEHIKGFGVKDMVAKYEELYLSMLGASK